MDAATASLGVTARYDLRAEIGRGAMGVVYRAYDREMGLEVALKTLPVRSPDQLYVLKREFRLLADIADVNLVNLYELVVDDARCFFTMELIDGHSFDAALRSATGSVDLPRFRDATQQLMRGLTALHQRGRLHRDVKPSNVLVTPGNRVVLLDFGLATVFGHEAGAATLGDVAGTIAYIAPEIAWGGLPSPAADYYSAGVMLFETLSGRLPFLGSAARIVTDKATIAAPRLRSVAPEVPAELDAIVAGLLEKEPDSRPSAEHVLSQLGRAAGEGTVKPLAVARGLDRRQPFVGRSADLAALGRAFDLVADGRPVICGVCGPSGIGKSELVRRFLGWLEDERAAVVLRGRCHPHEAVPYNALDALVDNLTGLLLSYELPQRSVLLPRHGAELARLFPVLGRVPHFLPDESAAPAVDAIELRRRGFSALREIFARIADRHPLVLWIDDAHWGDADSAALLREILRQPDAPAMLVLMTYRAEDEATSALLTGLADIDASLRAASRRIELGPMAAADAEELVRLLAPPSLAAHARMIAQEAGGSPFFLSQLMRHIAAEKGDGALGNRPHLQEVMSERVRALPAKARGVLEVIAVAARPLERRLVLAAAGLGEAGRPLVVHLEAEGFVRLAPRDDGGVAVEAYHDRIRESVIERLGDQQLRLRHRDLAGVLEGVPAPDPVALFRHHLGAGNAPRAAEWAADAGDRAASALAFDDAAELYMRALELREWPPERLTALQVGRAESLANAGRASEAAPIFLAVSAATEGAKAVEFRRRAVEQYLISGRVDDGVAILQPLLRTMRLPYPATPRAAMLGALGRLVRLRMRGTGFRSRASDTLPAETLVRVDTCISAGRGLVAVDTATGGYLSLVGLQEALRAGEPVRVGRALATVGGALLVPAGGALARWGLRLVDQAAGLAAETGDPYLGAAVHLSRGQIGVVSGDWRDALTHSREALTRFRATCRGVTWECTLARSGILRALEELGDFAAYAREADTLAAESMELGDRYGEMTAALYVGIARIAQNDVPAARAALRAALGRWSQAGFQLQHFYAMRGEAMADLYEGQPGNAWQRIEAAWPELRRSAWLRVPITRVDFYLLRARVALALATQSSERARHLSVATGDAARLAREGRADTRAHAAHISAQMWRLRGDEMRADERFAAAIAGFTETAMALNRTCAVAGSGKIARQQFDADMTGRGIRDPDRWLSIYAPAAVPAGTD